jgi:hypothetical protein
MKIVRVKRKTVWHHGSSQTTIYRVWFGLLIEVVHVYYLGVAVIPGLGWGFMAVTTGPTKKVNKIIVLK